MMQQLSPLFTEAPSLTRWMVLDLNLIRGFKDYDKAGHEIHRYADCDPEKLQRVRDEHALKDVHKVIAYEEQNGKGTKWSLPIERNGRPNRGYGLFTKMVIGEEIFEGIIYIIKGDRQERTIIHQMFEEADFSQVGVDVRPLMKVSQQYPTKNKQEEEFQGDWQTALKRGVPEFEIDEATKVITVTYNDKVGKEERKRKFEVYPISMG